MPRDSDKLRDIPDTVTCGTIMEGGKARVCQPDIESNHMEIMPRGAAGELQMGGDTVIESYLLEKSQAATVNDAFYTYHEGHWFKTGERAVIHDNGEIEIIGRFKDIIIRAGENISPAAIESIIFSRFGLVAELIGISDELAGQIPLAIIKRRLGQEVDILKVRETLLTELDAAWVPEEIPDIEALGLEDFPRISGGKVQKNKLRETVLKIRRDEEKPPTAVETSDMLQTLLGIWTDLLKVSPGILTPSTSVHDWTDSLDLARFSGVLSEKRGYR